MLASLDLYLSGKSFISSLFLKDSFAGYWTLVWQSFPPAFKRCHFTLHVLHCCWWEVICTLYYYLSVCHSFLAFKIFILYLTFNVLAMKCLGVDLSCLSFLYCRLFYITFWKFDPLYLWRFSLLFPFSSPLRLPLCLCCYASCCLRDAWGCLHFSSIIFLFVFRLNIFYWSIKFAVSLFCIVNSAFESL